MSAKPKTPPALLSALAAMFEPADLGRQFVLGRSIRVRPGGWTSRLLGGWELLHAPDLQVLDVHDGEGSHLGWLLGTPLVPHRGPLQGPVELGFRASSERFADLFDDWLYGHAGQFAAVLLEPAGRVHVDPYSALPVLYDAELGLVSSSPFLLTTDGTIPDDPIQSMLDITRTGYWHILGSTPHARARRVIPNHTLDLATWESRRTWPRRPPDERDPDEVVDEVAGHLEGTLRAAAAGGIKPALSLTAGGDTRTLLACARHFVDDLELFTIAFPDWSGTTDVRTASLIAERFGLNHRVLPWREPTERDVALFLYRTGCLVGERRGMCGGPTYAQLGARAPYVAGVGSVPGIDLHNLHVTEDDLRRRPRGRDLVDHFGWPERTDLHGPADRWLEELPPLDVLDTYLLFRVEMNYGCWGGPLGLCYPESSSTTVYPFGHRPLIEAVMSLPHERRADGSTRTSVIRARWPELLDVPINQHGLDIVVRRKAARGAAMARECARRTRQVLARAGGAPRS